MTSFIFKLSWIFIELNILNNALCYKQAHPLNSQECFCKISFSEDEDHESKARLLIHLYMAWLVLQASDKEDFSRTLSYKTEIYQASTSELCEISKALGIGARMWTH